MCRERVARWQVGRRWFAVATFFALLQSPPGVRAATVSTGTYVGDGTDNRAIVGLGLRPDAVFIAADFGGSDNRDTVMRTAAMAGDLSCELASKCDVNRVQALLDDGFELGSDQAVNKLGRPYRYVALRADACSADFAVDRHTAAHRHPDGDAHRHGDADGNRDGHRDADRHTATDQHRNRDKHGRANADLHGERDTDGDADRRSSADRYRHRDAHAA